MQQIYIRFRPALLENLTYDGHLDPGGHVVGLKLGSRQLLDDRTIEEDLGPMGLPSTSPIGMDDRIAYPLMLRRLLRDESLNRKIKKTEKVN